MKSELTLKMLLLTLAVLNFEWDVLHVVILLFRDLTHVLDRHRHEIGGQDMWW